LLITDFRSNETFRRLGLDIRVFRALLLQRNAVASQHQQNRMMISRLFFMVLAAAAAADCCCCLQQLWQLRSTPYSVAVLAVSSYAVSVPVSVIKVLSSKRIRIDIRRRLRLYQAIVVNTSLWGSESWALKKEFRFKLEASFASSK
jgi:hypothetical protein